MKNFEEGECKLCHSKLKRKISTPEQNLAFLEDEVQYEGNLKDYIDKIAILYNGYFDKDWLDKTLTPKLERLGKAIAAGIEIFGRDNVCRKYKDGKFEGRFNRAVYDVIIGSLHYDDARKWAQDNPALFRNAFIEVSSADADFVNSFETSTKNVAPTTYRFSTWYSKVTEISGIEIEIPNIVKR